ncbi:MAG: hypothetical protein JWM28_2918 [Chitinophagaceae bacterium]|nr:hypothetical protein [Chitinophagaceae bacterium]
MTQTTKLKWWLKKKAMAIEEFNDRAKTFIVYNLLRRPASRYPDGNSKMLLI